jgi:hypothetical protein
MKNKILVRTIYNPENKSYYVDIVPPMIFNSGSVTQQGTLYFQGAYSSKEEAYAMAKKYMSLRGISNEDLNDNVNYE